VQLPRLVERDEHLVCLHRLLADSLEKKGQVVLLDGPTASGKTELLRNFAERAARPGVVFLNATCSPAERALPFGVLSQLLHSATLPLPAGLADRVARLLDSGASRAMPTESVSEPVEPEMVRVLHGLCLALLELAAGTPLLLGVDDVQHADVPSLHCLLHLVRRLGSARILAVLTDDAGLRPSHSPFHAELLRQPHSHRLRLAPLSRDGVAHLLGEHLDSAAADRLAPGFFEASGGNPLLLHALIEDHRISGDARAQGYGLALLSCLHRGEAIMLRVVRALAVLGEDASPPQLGQLLSADAETVRWALRAMTAAGLLDNGRFRHPVAQLAVLDGLSPRDRSDLHRRAAQLLHDQGAPATAVARHLIEADHAQGPWAVDVLLKAAEQALLGDQPRLAVECLGLAHRSRVPEHDRAAIRAKLAQAEWLLNPSAAARHLAPLAAAMRAGHLDRRDRIALIRQLLWHGRSDEATDVLDRLRGSVHEQHAEAAAELHDTELWLTCSYPPLARRRQLATRLASQRSSLITPEADPWLQSAARLADVLQRGQSHEAVERAEQVLRDLHLSGNSSWAEESALLALLVLIYADRPDSAADWCDRLLAEAGTRPAPTWQAIFASARAETALRQGDLPAAARHAQAAMTHVAPKAWGVAIGLPLGSLVLAMTRMGSYKAAAKHLTHPVAEAMFESRYGLHYLYARGQYHLATNSTHAALADFLSCGELMRGWGLDVAGLVPWRTSAAESWLRLGNRDQARQLIYDQLARAGTDGSRTRGLSLRLLAAISSASRRPQLLTETLELFEECGDRFEQARALVDLSRAYHALDKSRRARMLFRRAWHVAKMCEATPLCRELLSVSSDLSGTVVPVGSDGMASLTSSERRVASLAVLGYTNREIASKLYITASTVEQHLTRVYRKLDIKHRKDLPVDLCGDLTKTEQAQMVAATLR
jgi:DNA-binding CsgD family transcriptional regulator